MINQLYQQQQHHQRQQQQHLQQQHQRNPHTKENNSYNSLNPWTWIIGCIYSVTQGLNKGCDISGIDVTISVIDNG